MERNMKSIELKFLKTMLVSNSVISQAMSTMKKGYYCLRLKSWSMTTKVAIF